MMTFENYENARRIASVTEEESGYRVQCDYKHGIRALGAEDKTMLFRNLDTASYVAQEWVRNNRCFEEIKREFAPVKRRARA